jgi:hypothetical protein
MSDDDLTAAQRQSLNDIRASRGACPKGETLVEYEALGAADRERHPEHGHIQLCSRCQLALHHMADRSAAVVAGVNEGRKFKLAFVLPLAAAALLAFSLTLIDRRGATSVPAGVDTVRGTELQATAPSGAVEILREFAWQSPIRAGRYRVIVRRGPTVVWQTETTALSAAPPPPGVIQRDVQYEWQVEAIDDEGHVRMTSPPQPFTVY